MDAMREVWLTADRLAAWCREQGPGWIPLVGSVRHRPSQDEGMKRSRKRAYSLLDFAKYKMRPLLVSGSLLLYHKCKSVIDHKITSMQRNTTPHFEDDYRDMSCYTPFQSILHIKFKISYQIAVMVDKLQNLASSRTRTTG